MAPQRGDGGVRSGWERIKARCCITFEALADPALGDRCAHAPRCNYDALRQFVGRHKACPVFGCTAQLVRTRAILRDEALRGLLAGAPSWKPKAACSSERRRTTRTTSFIGDSSPATFPSLCVVRCHKQTKPTHTERAPTKAPPTDRHLAHPRER